MDVEELADRTMTLVHENDSDQAKRVADLNLDDAALKALLVKVIKIHQRDVYQADRSLRSRLVLRNRPGSRPVLRRLWQVGRS